MMTESALIGSIQRFSTEDGPGIRTTVFLKGCPLSCAWCHNPELISPIQQLIISPSRCIGCGACASVCPKALIRLEKDSPLIIDRKACDLCLRCTGECYSKALKSVARKMTVSEVVSEVVQDKRFYGNTGGGLTVSGGEPLSHAHFVSRLIGECAARDIESCIETSGFGSFNDLITLANTEGLTAVLYDIKSIDDEVHKRYTGVSNEPIINNLKKLAAEKPSHLEILARLPLIKDVNDSPEYAEKTAILLASLAIRKAALIPYHKLGISKAKNIGINMKTFMPPEQDKISQLSVIYNDAGIETAAL